MNYRTIIHLYLFSTYSYQFIIDIPAPFPSLFPINTLTYFYLNWMEYMSIG